MSQSWPTIAGPDDVDLSKLTDRLDALRSSFAGTARPSAPVAGQLFFDTDTGPTVEICTNATGPAWAGLATVLSASELLAKILTVDGSGSGLDADLLDGQSGAYYLAASSYTAADVLAKLLTVDGSGSGIDADLLDGQSGAYYLAAGSYTAADVLAKLLTVDGAGSGIDADLLDAQSGAYYLAAANFTGTLNAAQFPALTGDITTSAGAVATTIQPAAITARTADTAPEMNADYALTYDNSATALKKVLLQYIGAGKQAFWVPAAAMAPRTTTPCATLATLETATNKINWDHLAFDTTTQEYAVFDWKAPKAIDTNTFTFIFVWSHPSTVTNFGVVWEIAGAGRGDADAMEIALGTAQLIADTGGTTDTLYITSATPAVTIGGTFTAEDVLKFQVTRVVANGSDTLAVDARLHGVYVIVNTVRNTEL